MKLQRTTKNYKEAAKKLQRSCNEAIKKLQRSCNEAIKKCKIWSR